MPKIKYPYEFDKARRKKAKSYTRIRMINGIVNGILLPLVFYYAVLVSGFSVFLKGFGFLGYILAFLAASTAVQFPLRFYSTFVLEHRYGLSRQKIGGWAKDYAKGVFLSYVFFVPVIAGVYALMPVGAWWVYAGVAYIALTLFMNFIFPVVIFPFFYKLEPYRDARMKRKLIKMAGEFGKRISTVLVAKESEKSVKANAMFAGIGATKRIVLFDNLLRYFRKDEVETVIGHELGHYVNKDTTRYLIIEAVKIFPVLLIVDYALRSSVNSFGIASMSDIASLPLFLLVYDLIDLALMPVLNAYSRHRESLADLFALKVSNKPNAQESTEKRLADLDLVDDKPNPIVEFILFSHPAPWRRIKMCREWKKRG